MSGVTGQAEVRRVARALKAAPKEMRRELYSGVNRAIRPLRRAIVGAVPGSVPSGYAGVLAPDLRVAASTKLGGTAGVEVAGKVSAKGRKQLRDVRAVNAGILRHKTFGRSQVVTKTGEIKSLWFPQPVRGGFVDRPLNDLADQVGEEITQAWDRVCERLESA